MRNGVGLQVNVTGALLMTLLLWGAVPPESPVADASMRGDVAAVRALVASGADVNAAQGDGMTALHWAAERGSVPIAEILIGARAQLDAVTRLASYTPLHLASQNGHAPVVLALLEAGADAKARTSTGGATALHFASAAGAVEAVRALLEHGADVDASETSWGQTPLMFAASAGRADVVRALIQGGADPSITATMVDLATREAEDRADEQRSGSRAERAQQQLGPQPGLRPQRPDAGPPSAQDRARAVREQAQRPGDRGAPTNAQPDPDRPPEPLGHAQLIGGYGGLTALLMAVRDGQMDAALALVAAGADIDQRSRGDATTPLLMATINGHFDLALELLARGANPNLMSDAGATPLYTVINTQWIPKSRHPQPAAYMQQQASYLEVMKALLDAGVDPNVRLEKQLWYTTFGRDMLSVDRMGATPFWRAAYALDIPAMELLVAYGADPNIPTLHAPSRGFGRRGGGGADPSGLPPAAVGGPAVYPIHAASGVGYGEGYAGNIHRHVPDGWLPAVKYLVEVHGADVNARDNDGYSAVHHAAARGDNELILYLVEHGADVTFVSRRGQTTVDMANGPVQRISPFPETIRLLEGLGAVNNHNCVSC